MTPDPQDLFMEAHYHLTGDRQEQYGPAGEGGRRRRDSHRCLPRRCHDRRGPLGARRRDQEPLQKLEDLILGRTTGEENR